MTNYIDIVMHKHKVFGYPVGIANNLKGLANVIKLIRCIRHRDKVSDIPVWFVSHNPHTALWQVFNYRS
jgi:hypothetical protein